MPRVDGQQQRRVALVDLVHAEDARQVGNDPRLIVDGDVDLGSVGAAPEADHLLVGLDPEVACQLVGNGGHRQPIVVHGLDRLLET
jgi:hypothetical protein